jgi:hypothetical protein
VEGSDGGPGLGDLSSREAVVAATEEYDRIGRAEFLAKYGFGEASQYVMVLGDRVYDPKAIAGAAVAYQFPGTKPLEPKDFVGGVSAGAVGPKLESLGFPVVDTGGLGPSLVRALVDIRDQRAPYESVESIKSQDLAPLLERGLIIEAPESGIALSPQGESALVEITGGSNPEALVLPQHEVDAFALTLETEEYERNERGYKVAVHLALRSLLSAERLGDPQFPELLAAFFGRKLDLEVLDLSDDDRAKFDKAVKSSAQLTAAFANLCGGGYGVNNFVWIPGAIEDGLGNELAQVFAEFIQSDAALAERIDSFRSALVEVEEKAQNLPSWHEKWTIIRPSLSFAAAILGGLDPQQFTFYLQGKIKPAYQEFIGGWPTGSVGEIYEEVVPFVDDVRNALERQGAPVRDLIDAQGFLYLRDSPGSSPESVWWVNQGSTYREEKSGGFIWAPLETEQHIELSHWTRLRDISEGDSILHYAKGSIRAVGTVGAPAVECPRPEELPADWSADGLRVDVDYRELNEPIPLHQIPTEWRQQEGAPFTRVGNVQQGYCYGPLSSTFLHQLAGRFAELADLGTDSKEGTPAMALEERIQQWRDEIGYPREVDLKRQGQRVDLAAALSAENIDAVVADPEQFDLLNFGQFAANAYGGPGPQSIVHKHLNTGPEAKRRLAEAMKHLIYDAEEPVTSRLDDVLLSDDWRAPGFGESLSTKALAVVYPDEWLPLFQTEGSMGKRVLMKSPELGITEPDDLDERTVGERIKWSNDALREVLDPHLGDDPWGQIQFLYWLRDQQQPESEGALDAVAAELYFDAPWLTEVVELLKEKKQIIFQGPPGTGKTYVARRLARHFEDLGGGKEIVQFHPSYGYEDFVEGYRPRLVGDQPGFQLVEGPLKRLARLAEKDPEHVYVLVIDELNRGNVAKVFGELYYLLEYRGDRIRLQYAEDGAEENEDAKFRLPKNLWIIATMNTADRSIALLDSALRRRFYFVDYYPDAEPVSELLERWLKDNGLWSDFGWLRDLLKEANKRLGEREAAIGPSHFLLKDPSELTEERIERIWNHAVLPYLEEQLIGEPERRKEFSLASLHKALDASESEASSSLDEAEGQGGNGPIADSPEGVGSQPDGSD